MEDFLINIAVSYYSYLTRNKFSDRFHFSQDIDFGENFSKNFVDSSEDMDTSIGLMNQHNNEAGRRVSYPRNCRYTYECLKYCVTSEKSRPPKRKLS